MIFLLKALLARYRHKKNFEAFAKNFRAQNAHNSAFAANIFLSQNVKIGRATYGPIEVLDFGNEDSRLEIGDFCSIASGVKFLTGGA